MSSISTQVATPADIPYVLHLLRSTCGLAATATDAATWIETSLINLVANDSSGNVVGYLRLSDSPSFRCDADATGPEALIWLESEVKMLGYKQSSSAYVRLLCVSPDFEAEAAQALLRASFRLLDSLTTLVMAASTDLSLTQPVVMSSFEPATRSSKLSCNVFACERRSVIPPLGIRHARVEDHDDMQPVWERALSRYPALAQLPESSRPEEAFALTRVVAGQDANNSVFVAEVKGRIVGFMVATCDVELSDLLTRFDLHPYDNLLAPELYEQQYQLIKGALTQDKLKSQPPAPSAKPRKAKETQEGGEEGEEAQEGEEGEGEMAAGDEAEGTQAPAAEDPEVSEEDVQAAVTDACVQLLEQGVSTAFAITLLCVDAEYEHQSHEFLDHAFNAFQSKSYCVLTLPHTSAEPPLTEVLTRLTPMPGYSFDEVLYIFSRHALIQDFTVRLALPQDVDGAASLTSSLSYQEQLLAEFNKAIGEQRAVVATVKGEVVGICTLNTMVALDSLRTSFNIAQLVQLEHQPPDQRAELDMIILNPIFTARSRSFLSGILSVMRRSCLYYALAPGQQPPDILPVLTQVPARHMTPGKAQAAEFALYLYSRRQAYLRRGAINAQVVVVGASDAGLAAVERLLLDPTYSFNYITLIAPGGIAVGGLSRGYDSGLLARLGLEARVNLVDADLHGLNREDRRLHLSDGSVQSYEVLALCLECVEPTKQRYEAAQESRTIKVVVTAQELASTFSAGEAQVVESIIVYGNTLDAYDALCTLDGRQATEKVRFIAPYGSATPMVGLLLDACAAVGLQLPLPEPMTLTAVELHDRALTASCTFQLVPLDGDDDAPMTLTCDILVGAQPSTISRDTAEVLSSSHVVMDQQLVVDAGYRTNDPTIFAAGPTTKLSRRYGGKVHLEFHNDAEAGRAMAGCVVSTFQGQPSPPDLAPLRKAKVVGCGLPGNLEFVFAGTPAAFLNPSLQPPAEGKEVHTHSPRGYLQLTLDAGGFVYSLLYVGRPNPTVPKLSALVGLHHTYLGSLVEQTQKKEVLDLVEALALPWIEVLLQDDWEAVREELQASAAAGIVKHTISDLPLRAEAVVEITKEVQSAAIESFMRKHVGLLPNLAVA